MEAFKFLWKPRGNIAIPNYDAYDNVDLQVKSLLYVFKRMDIANSSDKLERHPIDSLSLQNMSNLDRMYNLPAFEHVVANDAHRVLVDWPKNRFRAMLILAHMPQMDQLPQCGSHHFQFSILEADASNDEYIRTLSTSDIYAEHNLPLEVRSEIAATVVRRHRKRNLETRATVILEYLRLVATEIQVARIYKAMMGKVSPSQAASRSPNHSPLHSPSHSPSHSPLQSRSSSPTRFGRSPSPTRLRASPAPVQSPSSPMRFPKVAGAAASNPKLTSGPKLSASQQSSPLHGHEPHSPTLGSPSPSPPGSPGAQPMKLKLRTSQSNFKLAPAPNLNASNVAPSLDAGKKHVLQQARLAVKARIDKEQRAISGGNWIHH